MNINKKTDRSAYLIRGGGLTVTREIMRQLPNENMVYFGDTARVPYGSKSKDNIIRYSRQIIRFLQTKQVKAIVIACNTASGAGVGCGQRGDGYSGDGRDCPRCGGSRACHQKSEDRRDWNGATIRSHMYSKVMEEMMPGVEVIGKPCPLFVPIVEEDLPSTILRRKSLITIWHQ